MVEDSRQSSQPASGNAVFVTGDDGTSKDAVTINAEQSYAITRLVLTYDDAGTVTADVEIWDAPSGTAQADLSTDGVQLDDLKVDPGEAEIMIGDLGYDDVEDDVVVVVNNLDDEVTISVGGYLVTG